MPQEKIFVIDDSKDILEGMKMFLELKKYVIKTHSNTMDINEEIARFKPALILLDIYIAGKDTRHICRQLKDNADTKHIKVILCSAAPHALKDFKKYGADGCLQKPFGLEEFYSKIESVLMQVN